MGASPQRPLPPRAARSAQLGDHVHDPVRGRLRQPRHVAAAHRQLQLHVGRRSASERARARTLDGRSAVAGGVLRREDARSVPGGVRRRLPPQPAAQPRLRSARAAAQEDRQQTGGQPGAAGAAARAGRRPPPGAQSQPALHGQPVRLSPISATHHRPVQRPFSARACLPVRCPSCPSVCECVCVCASSPPRAVPCGLYIGGGLYIASSPPFTLIVSSSPVLRVV